MMAGGKTLGRTLGALLLLLLLRCAELRREWTDALPFDVVISFHAAEEDACRCSAAAELAGERAQKERTIEETYQKKTQLEHVLLRPDTYIGSVQSHTSQLWVYEQGKMVQRDVNLRPWALQDLLTEILVNAADNKQRDPSMSAVKVKIDPVENFIQVSTGHLRALHGLHGIVRLAVAPSLRLR